MVHMTESEQIDSDIDISRPVDSGSDMVIPEKEGILESSGS